jgi:hypothetical protein
MKNRTCSLVFTLPKEGTISSVVIRYLSGNLKSKECSRVDRMKDVSAKAWYGYPGDKASVQESIFQKLNQKLDTPISNADSESASQGAPAESQVAH